MICGYGKMGKTVEAVAKQRGHTISGRVSSDNTIEFHEFAPKSDAIIEFTVPHKAYGFVSEGIKWKVPVVSGTTGWFDDPDYFRGLVEEYEGAFFYSTNYSIGVNLFWAMSEKLAALMKEFPEFDARIEETHHTEKLDSPSGTAITLAERVLNQSPHLHGWKLSEGDPLPADTLPIIAHRESGVFGIHDLSYHSPLDTLQLIHTAHSREGFALGAVMAAEWLQNRKGMFSMKDMLGF